MCDLYKTSIYTICIWLYYRMFWNWVPRITRTTFARRMVWRKCVSLWKAPSSASQAKPATGGSNMRWAMKQMQCRGSTRPTIPDRKMDSGQMGPALTGRAMGGSIEERTPSKLANWRKCLSRVANDINICLMSCTTDMNVSHIVTDKRLCHITAEKNVCCDIATNVCVISQLT